jgi:hypothetical protein
MLVEDEMIGRSDPKNVRGQPFAGGLTLSTPFFYLGVGIAGFAGGHALVRRVGHARPPASRKPDVNVECLGTSLANGASMAGYRQAPARGAGSETEAGGTDVRVRP